MTCPKCNNEVHEDSQGVIACLSCGYHESINQVRNTAIYSNRDLMKREAPSFEDALSKRIGVDKSKPTIIHTEGGKITLAPGQTKLTDPIEKTDMTPSYYGAKCKCGLKMDPYAICDAYDNVQASAHHHALKKLLRAGEGHKELKQDISEVIDSLNRWKEQL